MPQIGKSILLTPIKDDKGYTMLINNCLLFMNAKFFPLLFSIIGFGFLIIIHELGHFMFCKLFGVHTPTFSIGFGPKLFERKIGTTNFRLAAIPFGGYVEMAGNAEIGQGEQQHAQATGQNSFADKYYWQKFLIMCGGIIFNLLSAYIIFCALFLIGDSSKMTVLNITKDSAAEKAGLQAGDLIIAINKYSMVPQEGERFTTKYERFFEEIAKNPHKEITLSVQRDNKTLEITALLGSKEQGGTMIGSLGSGFNPRPIQKLPFKKAIIEGVKYTNHLVYAIAQGLKNMFTKKSLEGAGGPLAIVSTGFQAAQTGIMHLFVFLAMMSVNLAIFNLLPLGIVDGGQILFVTIEAIIRRPTPDWFKMGVNLLSLAMFAALFLYLTYNDIVNIFGKPIQGLFQKVMHLFGR